MRASKYGKAPSGHGKFWVAHGSQPELYSYGPFDDLEEAKAEARQLMADGEWVAATVGEGVEVELHIPDADGIFEKVTEGVYEQCGEASDGYLAYGVVGKGEAAELDEAVERAVADWLTKHSLWPTFCKVEGVCVLTADGESPA